MRNLLILIVIGAGFWYWYENHSPSAHKQGVYDENGNPIVQVFTATGCNPCKDSIKELTNRNVPFKEIVINPANQADDNVKIWRKVAGSRLPLILSGKQKLIGNSKAQLASLLGENFDTTYLTDTEKRYFSKHFEVDGSPKIVMYGTSWCPFCAKLRKEFQEAGIDYLEIDIEQSGEQALMSRVMEINGYPATWVGYTRVNGTTLSDVKDYL